MAGPELKGKVTLDDSAFEAGMRRVERVGQAVAGKVGGAFKNLASPIAAIGPAIAAAFAGKAIVSGVANVFAAGRAMQVLSRQTGASVYGLSILQAKFKAAGLDADGVGNAIFRLQKSLNGVEDEENKGGAGRLSALGLNLAAIKKLAPDQQLMAVGRAISALRDPTERTGAAMQIFGKSGAQLGALFNGPAFGAVSSGLSAKAAMMAKNAALFEQVSIKLGRVGNIMKTFYAGVADRVASSLIPVLDQVEKINLVGQGQAFGDAIAIGLKGVADAMSSISQADLVSMAQGFAAAMKFGGEQMAGIVAGIKDTVTETKKEIDFLKGDPDKVPERLSKAYMAHLKPEERAAMQASLPPPVPHAGLYSFMSGVKPGVVAAQIAKATEEFHADPYYSSLNKRISDRPRAEYRPGTHPSYRPETLPSLLLSSRRLSAPESPVAGTVITGIFNGWMDKIFKPATAAAVAFSMVPMQHAAAVVDSTFEARQARMFTAGVVGRGTALDFNPSSRPGWTGAKNASFSTGLGGAYGQTGNIWSQKSGLVGKKQDPVETIAGHVATMKEDIAALRSTWDNGKASAGGKGGGGGGTAAR